jgi:Ca2+-binding EF-hand superfamily protein
MFDALDSEGKGEVDLDDLIEIFKDQNLPDVYI